MSCCSRPDDPAPGTPASDSSASPGTPAATPDAHPDSSTAPDAETATEPAPIVPPAPAAPCVTCLITSETVMTQPPNRARLDIGVGERVRVTFSLGEANWTLAGDGFLSSPTGATITYRAPSRAQSITLTAVGGGCTANITFNIIAPTGVRMERIDTLHRLNTPTIGLHTRIFILPDTVNFHNIEIRELDVNAVASGIYACKTGVGHNPGASPVSATQTVRPGFGTRIDAEDTIFSGYCITAPNAGVGRSSWAIPWQYRLTGGTFRQFETAHQVHTCDAAGNLAASKARASSSATFAAPSQGSINGTPL